MVDFSTNRHISLRIYKKIDRSHRYYIISLRVAMVMEFQDQKQGQINSNCSIKFTIICYVVDYQAHITGIKIHTILLKLKHATIDTKRIIRLVTKAKLSIFKGYLPVS